MNYKLSRREAEMIDSYRKLSANFQEKLFALLLTFRKMDIYFAGKENESSKCPDDADHKRGADKNNPASE